MFCPPGYTTLAELWDRFQKERLQSFYISATRHYDQPDFTTAFVRGSPLDICEHVFLKSVADIGICLASMDGRIFKFYAPLEDGRPALFSEVPPGISTDHVVFAKEETGNTMEIDKIAGGKFSAWDGTYSEPELWGAR